MKNFILCWNCNFQCISLLKGRHLWCLLNQCWVSQNCLMQCEHDDKQEHLYRYPQNFRNNFISNAHFQESLSRDTISDRDEMPFASLPNQFYSDGNFHIYQLMRRLQFIIWNYRALLIKTLTKWILRKLLILKFSILYLDIFFQFDVLSSIHVTKGY